MHDTTHTEVCAFLPTLARARSGRTATTGHLAADGYDGGAVGREFLARLARINQALAADELQLINKMLAGRDLHGSAQS